MKCIECGKKANIVKDGNSICQLCLDAQYEWEKGIILGKYKSFVQIRFKNIWKKYEKYLI